MTAVSPPRIPPRPPERRRPPRIRWNSWNLLLLVPLLCLLTPLYNRIEPQLFGMPFFYWSQLVAILLGVAATALVYIMTKDDYVVTDRPDRLNVDILDEGAHR
jgi:hypothetical protein